MRYIVQARWWSGGEWEGTRKECKTVKEAIGMISLLAREVKPYQISYTDREQVPDEVDHLPPDDPLQKQVESEGWAVKP